jgi:amidase
MRDNVPSESHYTAERLRSAGVVLVATTIAPETAYAGSGESLLFGTARNPWDLSRVPGGSSAGSAAAVAARIVPVAGGSDGGGSIRQPASFSGVFGLKPSRGALPVGPPMADRGHGGFTEGYLSMSVRDTALFLDQTVGSVVGDPYRYPPMSFSSGLDEPVGPLKIGVMRTAPSKKPVWEEALAAVDSAALLCEHLGHHVEEAEFPLDWDDLLACWDRVMAVGLARQWEEMTRFAKRQPREDEVTRIFREYASLGRGLSALRHAEDIAKLRVAGRDIARSYDDFDIVLTPVAACETPRVDSISLNTASRAEHIDYISGLTCFTYPCNVSGLPAMSVPLHWTSGGLPVGVHFIGRFGSERLLLQLAEQLEHASPWSSRIAPYAVQGLAIGEETRR